MVRDTARPLRDAPIDPVPNDNYGWGLVDAEEAAITGKAITPFYHSGNGNSGGCTLYELDEQVMQFLPLEENDINDILVEVENSVSQISAEIFGKA